MLPRNVSDHDHLSLSAVVPRDICLAGNRVLVRCPTIDDAGALAELLCTDHVQHRATGMSGRGPSSATAYLADTAQWAKRHNAICLATVSKQLERAVGMISLSHIDLAGRTGRIGYWTASACWRQGLTGEAFGLVLQLARSLELKSISATIETNNIASQRIYQCYGAIAGPEQNGRRTHTILLDTGASQRDASPPQ